jgi:hypothetical protein
MRAEVNIIKMINSKRMTWAGHATLKGIQGMQIKI